MGRAECEGNSAQVGGRGDRTVTGLALGSWDRKFPEFSLISLKEAREGKKGAGGRTNKKKRTEYATQK